MRAYIDLYIYLFIYLSICACVYLASFRNRAVNSHLVQRISLKGVSIGLNLLIFCDRSFMLSFSCPSLCPFLFLPPFLAFRFHFFLLIFFRFLSIYFLVFSRSSCLALKLYLYIFIYKYGSALDNLAFPFFCLRSALHLLAYLCDRLGLRLALPSV